MPDISEQGTVAFWAQHEQKDWPTNNSGYNFGPYLLESITVMVKKHPDLSLEVGITGPFNQVFNLKGSIPKVEPKGVHIMVTWKRPVVTLYVGGAKVDSATV